MAWCILIPSQPTQTCPYCPKRPHISVPTKTDGTVCTHSQLATSYIIRGTQRSSCWATDTLLYTTFNPLKYRFMSDKDGNSREPGEEMLRCVCWCLSERREHLTQSQPGVCLKPWSWAFLRRPTSFPDFAVMRMAGRRVSSRSVGAELTIIGKVERGKQVSSEYWTQSVDTGDTGREQVNTRKTFISTWRSRRVKACTGP